LNLCVADKSHGNLPASWNSRLQGKHIGAVKTDLERSFTGTVRPFVENYRAGCQSGEKPAAQFDLHSY